MFSRQKVFKEQGPLTWNPLPTTLLPPSTQTGCCVLPLGVWETDPGQEPRRPWPAPGLAILAAPSCPHCPLWPFTTSGRILSLARSSGRDLPSLLLRAPPFPLVSFTSDNEMAVAALRGCAKHCCKSPWDGSSHHLLPPSVSSAGFLPGAPGSPWSVQSSYLSSSQAWSLVQAA